MMNTVAQQTTHPDSTTVHVNRKPLQSGGEHRAASDESRGVFWVYSPILKDCNSKAKSFGFLVYTEDVWA